MKILAFILLLLPSIAVSQITFFAVATNPADNGSLGVSTVSITPPGSMVAGDLVYVVASQRGLSTYSVNNDGGQSWTPLTYVSSSTTRSAQAFWCRFDGTWDASPSWDFTLTGTTSVQMLVFRPTSGSNTWANEVDNTGSFDASSATKTITGVTPTNNSNVTIAMFYSADDNTWGNLAGTNWIDTGTDAQYRNIAGSDASNTYAYQIQSTAAATNNVSKEQLTLGPDAGVTILSTFYEIGSGYTSPIKNRIVND